MSGDKITFIWWFLLFKSATREHILVLTRSRSYTLNFIHLCGICFIWTKEKKRKTRRAREEITTAYIHTMQFSNFSTKKNKISCAIWCFTARKIMHLDIWNAVSKDEWICGSFGMRSNSMKTVQCSLSAIICWAFFSHLILGIRLLCVDYVLGSLQNTLALWREREHIVYGVCVCVSVYVRRSTRFVCTVNSRACRAMCTNNTSHSKTEIPDSMASVWRILCFVWYVSFGLCVHVRFHVFVFHVIVGV